MKYATPEYIKKIRDLIIRRDYAFYEKKGQIHSRSKITLGFAELADENDRLKGLLRTATKALTCCTIVSFKEGEPIEGINVLDKVTHNIWRILESPDGRPNYIWWERQIDPNVKFVNSDGTPYEYSVADKK